ncbi:MAG: xanthine dehydrogenase family protein molybdopterin-binding subunit [Chloroflexi bacterium]|nr:xanthine dehydrogenase family protein molybdopterin-binding subunit [Chloroflexota bacterium]MBV9892726.1 xanthine dehydrogenase family protein molybdopterin-binding subunit [Chloroflexota bacterium]
MSKEIRNPSRRRFLRNTGALVVTFSLAGLVPSLAEAAPDTLAQGAPPPPIPIDLNGWVKIQADGNVKVFTGRVELGQGNQTALSQIVADELDVPFDKIDMVMGDTAITPDQGPTWGSTTIRDAGSQLRQAAAEARMALVNMAAKQWNVSADSLSVANGVVSSGANSISYSDLIGNNNFKVQMQGIMTPFGLASLTGTAKPKDPSQYRIVGTSVPRVDIPLKMTGQFTFMQDVKVPGMLHGRVVRPAGIHSNLLGLNGFDPPVPGARVVQSGDFVGVVAENEWDAIQAAQNLQAVWSDWEGLPDMNEMQSFMRGTKSLDHPGDHKGDAAGAIAAAPISLQATYFTPFEMHASIGPSCAIADVQGDRATIWTPFQGPHLIKDHLANLLMIPADNIHVINVEGSGCYGGNGHPLVTADAAVMSQLVGKPVRVQWMRADEHGWESKGPAMIQDLSGGVDPSGNLLGYSHTIWTPPHYAFYYPAGELMGRWVGIPIPGAFNLPVIPYTMDNLSVFQYDQSFFAEAIRTSWLRAPAQFQHVFALESFMDELASASGQDPVQFRLKYMTDPRLIEALNTAVTAAGWETRPSPGPDATSGATMASGRGVAITNRDGTLVAEVAEVTVNRSTGDIHVDRFTVAHDCGLIINPKAVQAQVESNIIQATSRTLKEQVAFDNSNVTSLDWRSYPILTFPEVPQVNTVLINRPDQPATGAGEGATCPVAAAISNAVFDATGVRLRSLPFRPDAVRSAFAAATA